MSLSVNDRIFLSDLVQVLLSALAAPASKHGAVEEALTKAEEREHDAAAAMYGRQMK